MLKKDVKQISKRSLKVVVFVPKEALGDSVHETQGKDHLLKICLRFFSGAVLCFRVAPFLELDLNIF